MTPPLHPPSTRVTGRRQTPGARSLLAFLVAPLVCGAALAADPRLTARQDRVWAATCATCHAASPGTPGAPPALFGRDAEHTHQTLLAYKAGQRPEATVMHQIARGFTDEELRRIARHFAGATPDDPGRER